MQQCLLMITASWSLSKKYFRTSIHYSNITENVIGYTLLIENNIFLTPRLLTESPGGPGGPVGPRKPAVP